MGYWDNIDDVNSPSLMGGGSSSYYLNNYFDETRYKLLDEWLEEDRILLSEATIDPHWADNWFTGLPGSIWNSLKGLVVGTLDDKGAVTDSFMGKAADASAKHGGDSTRGLAGYIKSWFGGGDPNKDGIINGIKVQADKLGDFMRNNTNVTTAGLAAAGLLGTYYLYKKWKNNKDKKPDAATIKTAVELDQKNPNEIPPSERNQKVKA